MSKAIDAPYVSIIISNFNGMNILPSCLNSLENQTYTRFETIVVDDNSRDASVEMLESDFSWARVVKNPRNLGASGTKNAGLKEARHELVVFLDNDAVLDERWLEEMVREISANDQVAIVASKILFSDNRKIVNSTGGLINLAGYGWDRGIFQFDNDCNAPSNRLTYACSAAMIARRSIIEGLGAFDAVYEYPFEDADLGWRANLAGYEVRYNRKAIAYHKVKSHIYFFIYCYG